MSIPGSANPLLLASAGAAAGYQIERSVRLNEADSPYLGRTPSSASNTKVFTFSAWVKRSGPGTQYHQALFAAGGGTSDNDYFQILFEGDTLRISALNYQPRRTYALYRDYSAWLHLLVNVDLNQASNSNKYRAWINNEEVTWQSTSSNQTNTGVNTTTAHYIGAASPGNRRSNCYLTEVHFVDGQALDPTSFGEFDDNNVWQPIEYTGTYNTNGFYLPFSDNSSASALGTDYSGNSNNWSVNNISVAPGTGNDSLRDSPTNGGTANDTGAGGQIPGNYATLNPLVLASGGSLTNGNLDLVKTSGSVAHFYGTVGASSGKWYYEYVATAGPYIGGPGVANYADPGGATATNIFLNEGGDIYLNLSAVQSTGVSWTTGDVIGVAIDLDAKTIQWRKNNVIVNSTPYSFSGASGNFYPNVHAYTATATVNFGQRAFAYSAPSGFKALCTANLDTPTIADGSTVMDVALYTGNSSTQTISGLGFSPDFLWFKARSVAYSHALYDTVRGYTKSLVSNATLPEATESGGLSAFNSDGFSLNGENTAQGSTNTSGQTYVAWAWDAGSSTVTNTDGTITSSVRANASAGFSIVSYTGTGSAATVGHGLNVAPSMMLVKQRSGASSWAVYHASLGSTQYLELNTTIAAATATNRWNDTDPTSSVFSVSVSGTTNNSGKDYISYCFAPVEGYSAFGSYLGNGSSDGPMVYTGFRPAFVLLKCSSAAGTSWTIHDNKRLGYNPDQDLLFPDTSDAENPTSYMDFLSNGFKLRIVSSFANASGSTFIYAAFAENPFRTARAR